MTRSEPNWDLWRAFGAVMDAGTLSAAARRLSLTQPTVGRQIEALESALGYPLFVRSQQGLTPTEDAQALAPLAATMAATASALSRAGAGEAGGGRGRVRITASEVVAYEVLPPILSTFRAEHPQIELELSASNQIEDLSTREADIAIRMASPTQQVLVGKKIGNAAIKLYAHRAYLARAGPPAALADLAAHTVIGYDRDPALLGLLSSLGVETERRVFAVRSDNQLVQQALLRAGVGIGGMQEPLARRTPDLIPVLPDAFAIPMEIWLVMHEDLRRSRPVRLLFECLEAGLSAYLRPPSDGETARR